MNQFIGTIVFTLSAVLFMPATAATQEAVALASWLNVPATWERGVLNGLVVVTPNDVPQGATIRLLVEPLSPSIRTVKQEYEQATRDLGPWTPNGDPVDQRFQSGWAIRQGVGNVILNDREFIANIAVAKRGTQKIRFWALADSHDTFKRYEPLISAAFASAQGASLHAAPAKAAAGAPPAAQSVPRATPTAEQGKRPARFGEGLSGVYVGVERGLSASAGAGLGVQQVVNPSTGRFETSSTGATPQSMTQISDYAEVDVFFPDGTYRRRLPIRGLMTEMTWERQQQSPLWGSWSRQGNTIAVKRGSYTTSYTLDGNDLISSRGTPWVKLPLHTGTRLDGTYARHDVRYADAPRLVLKPDGTYREMGDFLNMVGSPWHLVEPDGDAMLGRWNDAQFARAMAASTGTYSFDNFTLTFRTDDGRIWQINAYMPAGESAPRPARLIVNGYQLVPD